MKVHLSLLLATTLAAQAGSRSSASYHVAADVSDAGGRRAASASYTNDGSIGSVAGISTVAAPAQTVKHGYVGQLYGITGLTLTAGSSTVGEGASLALGAWQALDDASFLAVGAAAVAWSVQSGPLTGISAGGIATAGIVFQNTAAVAQGTFLGQTGTLALTVLNTDVDNFGTYATDGVDDAWQVQYFGPPPNANAGALADADGDGHTNAFEFTAGLVPTDATSVFRLRIEAVVGQPAQKRLVFSPRFPDRTYVVKAKADLAAPGLWQSISASAPSDSGTQRSIIDLNASGARKFYQVEISKP